MFSIGALACAVSGGGSRRRKRGEVLFHLYRESDWQRQYTYLHNINDVDVAALSPSTSGQFNACARWNVIDCKIAMNKSLQSFHLNSLTHTLLRQLRMLLFFFYYYYFVLFHLLFAYLLRISVDSVGRGIALPLTDVCLALLLGKVIKFFKCNSVYWQLQQWWMLNEQYQGADAMAVHRQSRADRSTKELNAIMRVHICYICIKNRPITEGKVCNITDNFISSYKTVYNKYSMLVEYGKMWCFQVIYNVLIWLTLGHDIEDYTGTFFVLLLQ